MGRIVSIAFFFLFIQKSFSQSNTRFIELKKKLPEAYRVLGKTAFTEVFNFLEEENRSSYYTCLGRLTLTSGTPITTSDVTAAGTIYFTPYQGGMIALYDGSSLWQLISFSEVSVSVPATTNTPFDIFGYNNGGALTLETVNWTNDTTRATTLTTQNGVPVKTGATTRRYLGTARTTGTSAKTEDSNKSRYLWNMCNRVPRTLQALADQSTWDYTTDTWRPGNNNDTTLGKSRFDFVLGQSIEPVKTHGLIPNVLGGQEIRFCSEVAMGIGLDSTSSNSADLFGFVACVYFPSQPSVLYSSVPSVGYHYIQWLEISQANGTSTWIGNSYGNAGILGEVWQ